MTELNDRTEIHTPEAPAPGGAYSQGIAKGGLLSTAGQVGIDPHTGQLVDGIEAQTRQALVNVGAVLEAAGSSWDDVIKTTCFLANITDFERFNAVYSQVVPNPKPARSTIGVSLAGGLLVEIEALAVVRT